MTLSAKEIVGQRFGRLVVLRSAPLIGHNRSWFCRCDCGVDKQVRQDHLRGGQVVSCGCYLQTKPVTHGLAHTREYAIWQEMRQRCENPNDPAFDNYGWRGIRVCSEWQQFDRFYADMGPRPSARHSIDRRDNDGDYAAGNCRWATRTEQANNTRVNRLLTHNDQTMTMTQWASRVGISYETLRSRIDSHGWSIHRALTEPVHR